MNTAIGSSLEHPIGADGLLALRVRSGDIRITAVDGEVARIRDANDEPLDELFTIDAATGSLSLTTVARGLEFMLGARHRRRRGGGHEPDLEIDLPRGAALVLEAVSSDIKVDGLLGDQRYRTTSGDVTLRGVAGQIEIDAVSGDIAIQAIDDAQVRARSESGDIELRAATLTALKLITTSGDIKVAGRLNGPGPFSIETISGDGLLASAGDVRISMMSLTGDLQSEIAGQHGSEHGRHTLAIGTSGPVVTFQSMSGDLRVVKPVLVEGPARPARPAATAAPTTSPTSANEVSHRNGAIAAAYDDARLRILRSLERGEIDVAEAGRRLEQLDSGDAATAHDADDADTATRQAVTDQEQRSHA
jgi:hypothetical protein